MNIPLSLCDKVNNWALQNYQSFKHNGSNRQYLILNNDNCPKEVWDIKALVVKEYKLEEAKQEPLFQDYCGFITEGGAIHRHSDANQGELIHTRFNVMISKPVAGGIPVQNDKEISVEEGSVWRCDAGSVEHWCTEVKGNKPRVVLSFGFLL